jgi:hypothetical protein
MRRSATPRRQSAKPQWDVGRPAVNFYIEVFFLAMSQFGG